jgi:alpha-tubulin suppressor-like RCC1 family protein
VVAKPDGTVWTWGSNSVGQLGNGSTTPAQRLVPDQLSALSNVTAVAAGADHSLALLSDGSVWAWGANMSGQLGDGTNTLQRTPVPVNSLTDVIAIAAGQTFSLALKSDKTVWAWGSDSNGQLGDNASLASSNVPVQVFGLTDIRHIAAGMSHGLAVKGDGTVWSWGANSGGQLGNNSTTQQPTPVQMIGVTNGSTVTAGSVHSLVLKTDGTVMATGYNDYGELGLGDYTQRTTAVTIPSLSGVAAISAGYRHSVVLKADGTLWTFGANDYGQLAAGPSGPNWRHTPAQVGTLNDVALLGTSFHHVITASTTGVVRLWGYNTSGQIGDGTVAGQNTLSPVDISDAGYLWKVGRPLFSPKPTTQPFETVLIMESSS